MKFWGWAVSYVFFLIGIGVGHFFGFRKGVDVYDKMKASRDFWKSQAILKREDEVDAQRKSY